MSNEVAEAVTEVATTVAATAAPAQRLATASTRAFFTVAGKVKRFSPEILTVVGVAGVITAGVLACKATLKLEDVVGKAEEEITDVKDRRSVQEFDSEMEYNKALARVYVMRSVDILKLYTPALSVGIVSLGCLLGAHGILNQRNVSMAAAVKAGEASFAEYRKRVAEELGEDKERDIRFGLTEKEIPTFDEDGKQNGTKKVVDVANGRHSGYARFFDAGNEMWDKTPGQNQMFLTNQQNWLNDRLNARGYLFLNDVYKSLGFPETPEGQVVGWLSKKHEDSKDGEVDFGLFEIEEAAKRDFVNGFERTCILDFNVDGVIFDKI